MRAKFNFFFTALVVVSILLTACQASLSVGQTYQIIEDSSKNMVAEVYVVAVFPEENRAQLQINGTIYEYKEGDVIDGKFKLEEIYSNIVSFEASSGYSLSVVNGTPPLTSVTEPVLVNPPPQNNSILPTLTSSEFTSSQGSVDDTVPQDGQFYHKRIWAGSDCHPTDQYGSQLDFGVQPILTTSKVDGTRKCWVGFIDNQWIVRRYKPDSSKNEWFELLAGNQDVLPESYFETNNEVINNWLKAACQNPVSDDGSLALCNKIQYEGLEISPLEIALIAGTITLPLPGDELLAVRYTIGPGGVKTVVGIIVLAGGAIYTAFTLAEMRHSNPDHNLNTSATARVRLGIVTDAWFVSLNKGGPGKDTNFICKVVTFAKGLVYTAVYYSSPAGNAYITVFGSKGWISAYEATTANDFINAQHRGMKWAEVVDCNNIFPPPSSMIAP